jgi:serine/threonine protein kinase
MQSGFNFMTDIWSLGATVFEMLTTFPPFYDKSANQWTIMHKIAGTEELPYLSEAFSDQVKDFVYSCMK